MSGETVITVVGNVVDEQVSLRYTPSGAGVCKFTVASTPRTYNRDKQAWEDGQTLYLPVSVWRQQGENCGETLTRGMRVVVQGRLSQRSYEDKQGVKRTVYEMEADEVAVSLRSATAKVEKTSSGGGGQGRQQYEETKRKTSQEGREDPWASGVPGTQAAGAWAGGDDSPPF
ncbi:Single-stranded DNA-binding protein 2 (plasmid) [Streptomyces ambofaciens ATCC 23877]|uniref:Single-stranded DNA-binding protein n=1 Tax=Streptomyces ambofaciens (strain ATCC 23877 / 3486 / DSM 40053 / JCM 4204 / NBRC 12836 / NRRL B-2516) TaxID=278992 RepID=A0A0K2B6R2_STRA7|nr:single-stranded DNA-binding protein [Streptomyces ambofaciens]AKZ60762.1 Single-stranded DNA-binding protein 2 [Streptomyces ambofaciens ATCC 23877]